MSAHGKKPGCDWRGEHKGAIKEPLGQVQRAPSLKPGGLRFLLFELGLAPPLSPALEPEREPDRFPLLFACHSNAINPATKIGSVLGVTVALETSLGSGGTSVPKGATFSKRIEEFEPIARSRAGGITFSLVTSDSLHKVLSPAFLDRFSTSGLRKFDRIQVNADCQGAGERAMLLVEENLEGKVKVRKL